MKIFFNRVPRQEPYGGGNQFLVGITDRLKAQGHEVIYHLKDDIDIIFMMDPRPGDIGYNLHHIMSFKHHFPKVKIIHRVNECDKRKGTNEIDRLLLEGINISDRVVFISEWLQGYFKNLGCTKSGDVIYNGCDTDHFTPRDNDLDREKIRLVTHHWSDNWMKGFDLYTDLDKHISSNPDTNLEFTYIGRYYKDYTPRATRIVSPTFGRDLGDKLRDHDIYITASRFEPCGMHHVEGSASGLPVIYHSDGGGINELCKNHGVEFTTFDQFLGALNTVIKDYKLFRERIDYNFLSLNRCLDEYIRIIEGMV